MMEKLGDGLTDVASVEEEISPAAEKSLTHGILATAYSLTGVKYLYGGTSPESGFDCSGFVRYVFSQNGVDLPRSSGDLMQIGVKVSREDLRPGDLLFYWRTRGGRSTHVGLYTGDGLYMHSPRTGYTVEETEAFGKYTMARFIQARRIYNDPNAAPLPKSEKEALIAQALASNLSASAKKKSASSGNTASVKKKGSSAPSTAAVTAKSASTYKVKPGDSIWIIAHRLGISPSKILGANGLGKKHTLRVGQKLNIPGAPSEAKVEAKSEQVAQKTTKASAGKKVKNTPSTEEKVYQVKQGDSIWILARKFGVSTNNIIKANKLNSGRALKVGQTLAIP
ncbi:MAG: LysM peptidoglycan-binding domain-containing protein [Pseudomonadota bacterium]